MPTFCVIITTTYEWTLSSRYYTILRSTVYCFFCYYPLVMQCPIVASTITTTTKLYKYQVKRASVKMFNGMYQRAPFWHHHKKFVYKNYCMCHCGYYGRQCVCVCHWKDFMHIIFRVFLFCNFFVSVCISDIRMTLHKHTQKNGNTAVIKFTVSRIILATIMIICLILA